MIGLEFLISIYGFKNKDIADKLQISPVTVHDWIKGKRKIPLARIEHLSEIFQIPRDYFQKELNEIDKLEIQKLKIKNDIKNKKGTPESDFKKITLEKMVDMLNEVARSEYGGITIETCGVIEIPMVGYARCLENDWGVFIEKKVENNIIFERFIIRDDNMKVEDFIFDAIEIVGDIIYDPYENRFSFCFDINLEVTITVYDYEFKD